MNDQAERAAEITSLLARLAELLGDVPAEPEPPPQQVRRPIPKRVLLTPEEAAEALGIGRTLMYSLIKRGEIESVRIGRLRRISTDALAPCIARISEKSTHTPKSEGNNYAA